MHIEQNNKTKWIVLALVGLIIGGVLVLVMFLNKPRTYKTPAAGRPGARSVVCRWNTSQIQPGYSVVISLLDNQGKIIRVIPDPAGNSYTFKDVDQASFPARCRLELVPKKEGLEACVKEIPVTCQNVPTETPTPGGPTNTPVPSISVTPGGPTNTPVPSMTPSIPTATPIKSGPTPPASGSPVPSTPPIGGPNGPTNTPVPLAPTTKTAPGQPTSTPAPTNTSVPNGPTKFPELPKAGINTPTMLIIAMGVVVLLLAFAL